MARLREMPPLAVDIAMAVLATGTTLDIAASSYPPSGPRPFDTWALLLTLAANAPVALRHRDPRIVLLVCTAALAVFEACGYWLAMNQLGAQIAFFTVATKCSRRWTVLGAAILYPAIMYGNVHTWTGSKADTFVLSAAWVLALGVFGNGSRRLAEHNTLVVAHAEQLRREVQEREERAVLDERIRIARELHDVVAHHMSVIAVQAGLAKYVFTSDPDTAQKAMTAVSDMATEGLQEARRLVTVLRPAMDDLAVGDQDALQTRDIGEIPAMVERIGLTGVAVRLTVTGTEQPLSAGVGLCVYRIVQESLTNVLKHSAMASAEVCLHYSPREVRVRIVDSGRRGAPRPHPVDLGGSGGGKGLMGMRERAMLYGGTLTAGRLPGGGFEVVLVVPIRAT
jgi:signal transduction histidine kinase